ncbi:PAS domain S-box protein, partial [Hydrogenophaga sp. XSHU_21]
AMTSPLTTSAPGFWHALPGMVVVFDDRGRLQHASQSLQVRLGPLEVGSNWFDRMAAEDQLRLVDRLTNHEPFETDIRLHGPASLRSRTARHLRLSARWIPDQQAWVAWLVDLTAHRRRCHEAREERSFLEAFADALPVMISYYDRNRALQYANQAYVRQYRLDVDKMRGMHVSNVLGTKGTANIPFQEKVFQSQNPVRFRRSFDKPDGAAQWVDVALVPMRDPSHLFVGTASLTVDVTLQHQAQEALRESQERLRQFFDANAEGLVFHTAGVIIDANPAACGLLGNTVEQLLGTPLLDRIAVVHRTAALAVLEGREDATVEIEIRGQDGTMVPVELFNHQSGRGEEGLKAVVMRDIRDRRQAQARIHALIEDLRSQKDRAESADRAKSVFLAAASHDLRQPIHALGLFL